MIKLLPFQEVGRDFLALRNNAILADDMGLGKTYEALEAIKKLYLNSGLIICPQSIRRSWVKRIREQIPLAFIKEITSPKLVPEVSAFNVINYDIVWKEPLITYLKEQEWPF
ncbi:MAG: SNF2-related protein, partial [Candidatus Subteraquimicrobiales bacterium]|nr:SNF2-related protein [Candidatus Subteraquimicrobiales bacterium]